MTQITLDGLPTVTRICECGCGRSLDGRDPRCRFWNAACRRRACRERDAKNIRQKAGRVRAHGKSGRSGTQMSTDKAVRHFSAKFGIPIELMTEAAAEVLSIKQRQVWEERRVA